MNKEDVHGETQTRASKPVVAAPNLPPILTNIVVH